MGLGRPVVAPLYVAFTTDSFWNQKVLSSPSASLSLKDMGAYNNQNYMKLINSAGWSMPIYWSKDGDPEYTINDGNNTYKVRIPKGATPMSGSDGAMIIMDKGRKQSYSLWQAVYSNGKWTCSGIAYYVLDSDGLCKTGSNEGHRGIAPSIMAIRKDELDSGLIPHKLEVFWPGTAEQAIYPPMCGFESNRGGKLAEGAIIALDPNTDVTKYGLSSHGMTIATCLRDYGAVVGDNSPKSGPCIKIERAAKSLVSSTELSKIGWDKVPWRLITTA